jgi:hypothetical protein
MRLLTKGKAAAGGARKMGGRCLDGGALARVVLSDDEKKNFQRVRRNKTGQANASEPGFVVVLVVLVDVV